MAKPYVREWRESRGLERQELVARSGVPEDVVCRIEDGETEPRFADLADIAKVFRVLPSALWSLPTASS